MTTHILYSTPVQGGGIDTCYFHSSLGVGMIARSREGRVKIQRIR